MYHEWEQIDQGGACCLNCGTDKPDTKCKDQPKEVKRDTLPRDAEIESIKRTLYNAIDKLDRLTTK